MTSCSMKECTVLDRDQLYAIQAFKGGHIIALIGGAGCGKSFVLNKLINEAERRYGKYPHVAACALTNKAANAMKGTTIHSLFGSKPSWEFSKQYLWEGVRRRPKLKERISRIDVLVIDEISLLKSNEIDAIDFVFRELAQSEWHASVPFGGRTIIVAGDPFQLEPYPEEGNIQAETNQTIFQSRSWFLTLGPYGDGAVVVLKHNHRQADDSRFFEMLNRVRTGLHGLDDLVHLNGTSAGTETPPNTHTRLFTTNDQVAQINREMLSQLPGGIITILARDSYTSQRSQALEKRLESVAPKEIALKAGAQVILTRKFGKALPGTQGVLMRIRTIKRKQELPQYQFDLVLSYVGQQRKELLPAFEMDITIGFAKFDVHGYDRGVIASRQQIPVVPAYAMTIHRSQGMTMNCVAIDFKAANLWNPCGLVYVALSRCRTFSGLWVKNLDVVHIRVSPRANILMLEIWNLSQYHPSRVSGGETLKRLVAQDDSGSHLTDDRGSETDIDNFEKSIQTASSPSPRGS